MQRFGTASVPTHSIGLALLKSEWQKAVSMILQKRHGEHPDVAAARDAWLVDGDLDTALRLLPKRVVAERCLLESFKKQGGDTRNAMGALSTVNGVSILTVRPNIPIDSTKSSFNVYPCVSIVRLECNCIGAHKNLWGRQTSCRRSCF